MKYNIHMTSSLRLNRLKKEKIIRNFLFGNGIFITNKNSTRLHLHRKQRVHFLKIKNKLKKNYFKNYLEIIKDLILDIMRLKSLFTVKNPQHVIMIILT